MEFRISSPEVDSISFWEMVTYGAEKNQFCTGSGKEVKVVLVVKAEGLIACDPDNRPFPGNLRQRFRDR